MDQEILGCQEDFEMSVSCPPSTPEQLYINTVITALQQIIIDEQFQSLCNQFTKNNLEGHFDQNSLKDLFMKYQTQIGMFLVNKLKNVVGNFEIGEFYEKISENRERVDIGVYDALSLCVNFEDFAGFCDDYRKAAEEQERYRVLTVKTNKMPENKKIKGNSQNIFACSNKPAFVSKPNKKNTQKEKLVSEKNEHELLVPETVLTIRGLRKC